MENELPPWTGQTTHAARAGLAEIASAALADNSWQGCMSYGLFWPFGVPGYSSGLFGCYCDCPRTMNQLLAILTIADPHPAIEPLATAGHLRCSA